MITRTNGPAQPPPLTSFRRKTDDGEEVRQDCTLEAEGRLQQRCRFKALDLRSGRGIGRGQGTTEPPEPGKSKARLCPNVCAGRGALLMPPELREDNVSVVLPPPPLHALVCGIGRGNSGELIQLSTWFFFRGSFFHSQGQDETLQRLDFEELASREAPPSRWFVSAGGQVQALLCSAMERTQEGEGSGSSEKTCNEPIRRGREAGDEDSLLNPTSRKGEKLFVTFARDSEMDVGPFPPPARPRGCGKSTTAGRKRMTTAQRIQGDRNNAGRCSAGTVTGRSCWLGKGVSRERGKDALLRGRRRSEASERAGTARVL